MADETLLIDNYDSFTYNLYQSLRNLGANVRVVRNSDLTPGDLPNLNIRNLIISPGPGHPKTDGGISQAAIRYFSGKVPVLGVCMGLECLVDSLGGDISYAGEIMHGKTSRIRHDGRGCFKNIPQGIKSTRYHSLSAHIKTLPEQLVVTACTEESGVVMAVRHREFTVEAVQYHPESILSESGDQYLKNFLALRGGRWEENPSCGVLDTQLPPFTCNASPSSKEGTSKLPSILETIHIQRLKDIELAKSTPGTTTEDLETLISLHLDPPIIPLIPRLLSGTNPALMAEIKRASPSKGAISLSTNAAQQALTYALAGASVISVLTEPKWFKGSLLDMRLARQAVDHLPNRPAILRKDFILDEYQVMEARLHGADTVLLIVAMLPPARLSALMTYARSLSMEPLVEVNSAEEMLAALDLGAKVIGVNNRNLHNFQVDMQTTTRLADMCKGKGVILCALSGITSQQDVMQYMEQGIQAVLVGESLMRAAKPDVFIRELLGLPAPEPAEGASTVPRIKVCGLRSADDALVAAEAGADLIGMIFAPKSKRTVDINTALEIVTAIRTYRAEITGASPPAFNSTNLPWFTRHSRTLPGKPLTVGVFQDQPLEEVLHIAHVTQLDLVQLHGSEPLQWATQIPLPVIRVFHTREHDTVESLKGISRPGLHELVLLDAVKPGGTLSGGSGSVVNLDLAKAVIHAGESGSPSTRLPIILAGGLNAENVAQVVKAVKPWAVDVSSGVETDDKKDHTKIQHFIAAVKGTR
jgi:anthranilate synthase/indole-3-glycerol phosphate synthase/phosphoribosylanthranilate isomerase